MAIQNSGKETVGSFLQKDRYFIPDYQREYAWEEGEQIDDFWADINYAISERTFNHFFGQVVIHDNRDEQKKYVIDGQQRTTTSIIFLAALRDLFEELFKASNLSGARNKVEDIRLKFIGRWSEEENELRLTLGEIDSEYFRKNIQINSPEDAPPNEDSHQRIKQAYDFFYNKLKKKLNQEDDYEAQYKLLTSYYSTFITGFQLMYVETDELNEAFIIFETLNARGKDLETSDLLKNHLFRTSGTLIEKVKSEWMRTVDNLDNIDITNYLRHYWNSRSNFIREKDLYKRMRDFVSTPKKSEEFVTDLLAMSDVYKTLVRPNEEFYFVDSEINKVLANLKTLNARSFYPIVLSMVNSQYSEDTILKVVQMVETFIFRNCVVAGRVANKYETLFAGIAFKISEKQITTSEEIFKELKPELLNDEDFENAFRTLTIKKSSVAKYILRAINNYNEQEIQVLENNSKIHLEHIMPKKLGVWEVDEETHQTYLHRIGNLTLLGNEYNTRLKNKSFDVKKQTYINSKIEITKSICTYDEWDIAAIEERQKLLFEGALNRWGIQDLLLNT
ncbi:DUF262 domain-containing protein [Pontibacillus yanchengensis]|uniref:DUF262 domain-containing protein n=1 Tax=Pontibacillus yanchengensis Y32 TaxID=1385514 RepID=A0A0A2TJ81_9BACI|nr:DUF262 domain-containing protein [Pontibacillus yanchengensis]KGP74483.1 hypothetical protein N782_12685 [Pontibacillus yanchengensis Y32]